MTTVDTIAQAIKEKKALEFAYHGFDRVVVPYACGLTPTNEIKMIGFQIGGGFFFRFLHGRLQSLQLCGLRFPIRLACFQLGQRFL